ncbi:MAG: hypothetical protein E7606_00695 [Ruminococcaceae bacterium]|nr:hypothetical protein [Oscillospiraceae bacterium]
MKFFKKILCLCMTLVVLISALAGCSSVKKIKSTKEESRIVGSCAGYNVRYEELRYIAYKCREEMKAEYGEDIFTGTARDAYEQELCTRVEAMLCESYAILDVCEDAGVKRSNRLTKDEVQGEVEAIVTAKGGVEGYRAYLESERMTDAVYRLYTAIVSCQYRYYDEVAFDKLEKEAYDLVLAHEGFVRTMSIFVKNDAWERVEDNRAAAEYVRAEVLGGKPLESFIGTKYNQDMSSCEYYFPKGYMEDNYERAAFALAIGEVSEVVETEEGFYVIQRLEPEEAYFETHMETLIEMYIVGKINLEFDAYAKMLSFEPNEYGKSLVLSELK